MPTQSEIQEAITARIIEGLENGLVPWRKPWINDPNCGTAVNVVSRRAYSGINPLLLDLASQIHGFTSRYWATYQQWQSLGGQVKKRPDHIEPGKWGTNIVFFKKIEKKKIDASGNEKVDAFPLMRQIALFNLEQVDGEKLNHLRPNQTISNGTPEFVLAEQVIDATGAMIKFGGNRAVYRRPVGDFPSHICGDFIQVPERSKFSSDQEFYSTCFHELVHWTECRLGWTGSYALGELIAEMGACFLCARANIPNSEDLSNHTAYLGNWLNELQNDRKFIFTAASQASKAAEFIMSFNQSKECVTELEEVET